MSPADDRDRRLAAPPFSPVLNPAGLWHVATITARQLVDLPNGGQDETDVPVVVDEPVSINPISANERAVPGGILATATHRIHLYWVKGIEPAQKVVFVDPMEEKTRTFEILSVISPEERAWLLELICVEKV